MWEKIMESRRALALYIGVLDITVLLIVAVAVGTPRVEVGVQGTLATGLVALLTVGVPALMASMGYTDGVEAKFAAAKFAPSAPAPAPESPAA